MKKFYSIRRNSSESISSLSDSTSVDGTDNFTTISFKSNSFRVKRHYLDDIPNSKLFYRSDISAFVKKYRNGDTKIVRDPELPKQWIFSRQPELPNPEEFLEEFHKVQKFVPKEFASYYKYVTGYQIYNTKNPVSLETFLEMHNGDRMDVFFLKYLEQIQKRSERVKR